MTKQQMKKYVLKLYKYKKISDYQFRNAIGNLEQLRDSDLLFYYFNMGRLHTAFGDIEDAMQMSLSLGMSIAMVIGVARAAYGIPIIYFLIPGYLIAICLMFIVPEIFTAIAFDSGGVTSGPMTATFVLPLMIGICEASGRVNFNIMKDAFGLVAMVAMMPLIVVQIMGIVYKIKQSKIKPKEIIENVLDDEIIVFKVKDNKIY